MSRRSNNFDHVRDLASRHIALIALSAEVNALNQTEREHYDWLIDCATKLLAGRDLDKQPAPAPRQRKPRQKPAEATA